ncbi:MAG: disulfide bond formation protein B [Bdellovibrionales bacterium]|nr:disulfide bond formation protein B [Bdellovibrionales bacterium]
MNNNEHTSSTAWGTIFSAWFIACLATMGSLFFSEVMKLPPCVLCWYQRICMYPLVVILLAGLFPVSKSVIKFSIPLAAIGWMIALYHNLLYYKILPESAGPCQQGISCTSIQLEWLGFITIPLLSLSAFTTILVLLIFTNKELSHE